MEESEKLKNEGNQKYAAGDGKGAVEQYEKALQLLSAGALSDTNDAAKKLEVTLCTNLSLAYMSLEDYGKSCSSAERAIQLDPMALKAHLRWVEARRRSRLPFDAFVHSLLYLRPLLRKEVEEKKISLQESTKILAEAEGALLQSLGISELAQGVELIQYNGGVDMISRAHFKTNDVLFVEKKYTTNFGEADLNSIRDLTTEMICEHFAQHLRLEQAKESELWEEFRQQFYGAWPRSLSDVDSEARETIGTHLRKSFPSLEEDKFEEILLLSLMCRYNCFYSGFFRACALANHNCQPNIAMKYNHIEETVTMTAVSEVKPGELLNVKYLGDAHFLMGLGKRREFLRSWLFWCTCDRCKRDNEPTSIQEFMQCPSCAQYTHMAIPGDTPQPDPLLRESVVCAHCSHSFQWDEEHKRPFRELLELYMSSGFPLSTMELWKWAREQLKRIRALHVHPAHWIYRMVFYFMCVPLTKFVTQCMGPVQAGNVNEVLHSLAELHASNGLMAEYIQPLLKELPKDESFSLSVDPLLESGECGSDGLKSLVILWHLIKDFYPAQEMWSIHAAICNLVLVLLLFPPTTEKLSSANALELLHRHGPYIETTEESKWLRTFNLYRTRSTNKDLPSQNKVKSAFHKGK